MQATALRQRREEELVRALSDAENYAFKHAGLGGFRGSYAHVIEEIMPPWFALWHERANWHPVGLLHGAKGWWAYVDAFGLSKEQWWAQIDRIPDTNSKPA